MTGGLYFKHGVVISDLKPEMLIALQVAEHVFGSDKCIVTSVKDGVHKRKSKHKQGYGVDLRIRHITQTKLRRVMVRLKERLTRPGLGFDVILEDDHIHIEYDPV